MSNVASFVDQVKDIASLNAFSKSKPSTPGSMEIKDAAKWLNDHFEYNKYLTIIEKATVNYNHHDGIKRDAFERLLNLKIAKGDISVVSEMVEGNTKSVVYKTPNAVITISGPVRRSPGSRVMMSVDYMDKNQKRKLVVVKDMNCQLVMESSYMKEGDVFVKDGRQIDARGEVAVERHFKDGKQL